MSSQAVLLLLCCAILTACEGGVFRCPTFGLKSVHDKFLSAQSDGDIEWNRNGYGSWEKIAFEQEGSNTGYLRSIHGKYLAATSSHRLEWDRTWKGSWEKFTIYQYENKVAFKSAHGRYLSAQSDGSVDVDRTSRGSWEWFTVYPQNCLTTIKCDCSVSINENNYNFAGVKYHVTGGSLQAYTPDRVGYQHIDNTDSSIEQSSAFSVSETVTETTSFTHTTGASVTVGTSFSTGIPVIAEGKISVEATVSYDFSYGTKRSVRKTMNAQYDCAAPAGKTVTCEALLFKIKMTVPYTQTWQHKRLPCTCESRGQFTEIAAHEMRLVINEE